MTNLSELDSIFNDEDKCIQFLFNKTIFYQARYCPKCSNYLKLYINERRFRCHKKDCIVEISIRKNSFFNGHRLPCSKILKLGWLWINKVPVISIINMTGHSPNTVNNFIRYYRQLIASTLNIDNNVIGGDGVIVEIDESKMGKRKYHKGHRVEGAWVFGGIERTLEKRIFLTTVPDRSAATLLEILNNHVLPGSIIYSDKWSSYNAIEELLKMKHMTVNHSKTFKDKTTGVHTNTIEGLWNGIKQGIKPRNRNKKEVDGYLMEYIWRKQNKGKLWDALLNALAEIHYN